MFYYRKSIRWQKLTGLAVAVAVGAALTACSSAPPAETSVPKVREEIPAPTKSSKGGPYTAETETPVGACRRYADQAAGRELEREYDVMAGHFRGGDSQVFRDLSRMDAQRRYRELYEACLRNKRAKPDQR